MLLIVGLGNIGEKYQGTRHNVGFMMIDLLAQRLGITMQLKTKFKAYVGEGQYHWQKIVLLKPTTFMNLSGEAVQQMVGFYKLVPEQIRVVYDDISLSLGKARTRSKGSAGGHNGIRSIIKLLGTEEFARIKIGIDSGYQGDLSRFVLGRFSKNEQVLIEEVLEGMQEKILDNEIVSESFIFWNN